MVEPSPGGTKWLRGCEFDLHCRSHPSVPQVCSQQACPQLKAQPSSSPASLACEYHCDLSQNLIDVSPNICAVYNNVLWKDLKDLLI